MMKLFKGKISKVIIINFEQKVFGEDYDKKKRKAVTVNYAYGFTD